MKLDSSNDHRRPVLFDVEAGTTYYWCCCGEKVQISSQPSEKCDECASYRAIVTETVLMCGCKQTKEPPFCDGSHAG